MKPFYLLPLVQALGHIGTLVPTLKDKITATRMKKIITEVGVCLNSIVCNALL